MLDADGLIYSVSNMCDEIVERVVSIVPDDVCVSSQPIGLGRELESIREIVDIERVVGSAAVTKHVEDTSLSEPKQDEESRRISRSVDCSRSQSDGIETPIDILGGDLLSLILRQLVVVGWYDRRVFVTGRVLHMTMNTLGAAVDKFSNPGPERSIE